MAEKEDQKDVAELLNTTADGVVLNSGQMAILHGEDGGSGRHYLAVYWDKGSTPPFKVWKISYRGDVTPV